MCYMDTASLAFETKSLDVCKYKVINIEEWHDSSNYNERRRSRIIN